MSGAAKETDSAQRIGTMLEEQINRIAQIEDDWHKIDSGSLNNDTQYSTPAKSDESQGSSVLEQGEVATSDNPNENDESQGSSGREQSEVAASGGSNDVQQHDKSLTPDPRTAVDHVLIDENPEKPNQRELDENGNLIPLPPATPSPEVPDFPNLPLVLTEKVVDPPAPAVGPSSDSTVNPSLLGDSPLSATYRSRSVKGSLRRPCRISKALKAAEVAGESLGVKDTPQDTQVIEGIVIGLSNATQAVSRETRQTEIKAEFVEVADLGMSNGFEKSGDVAENDVPRADDMAKRNHEIDSGEIDSGDGPSVEEGNMNSQHPREDTSDKAELVGDTAVSEMPKTDDTDKGVNVDNEDLAAQYPEVDNDEEEKHDDTAGSDVPKMDEMAIGDGDTAGIDVSEPDDVAKGDEDLEGSDVQEADDIAKEDHDVESDSGWYTENENLEAQYLREDNSDEADETAVSEIPKLDDIADDVKSDISLDIKDDNIEAQYLEEENSNEPNETAISDVPGPDENANGHKDVESESDLDFEDGSMEAQYPEKDNYDEADETAVSDVPRMDDRTKAYDDVESDRGLDARDENVEAQHPAEDNSDAKKPGETAVSGVPKTDDIVTEYDDIESDRGLDVKDWILWAQYSGEDVPDKEEGASKAATLPGRAVEPEGREPGDIEGSDVPNKDDIESDSGLDIVDGSMMVQHSGKDVPDKEEGPGDTVGSDVPKPEDHVEEQDDVEGGSGLGIEDGSMEQHPQEDVPDKEEGPSNTAASDAPKTENMMEEHDDIKRHGGLDINDEYLEARYPEMDGSDDGEKTGDDVANDMLVKGGVAEGGETISSDVGKEETSSDKGSGFKNRETSSDEGCDIGTEKTKVQHPGKIDIAGKVDFLRDFASRGLALLMVAKGFQEQEGGGDEQKAVEPPIAKKVDLMMSCNQNPIQRGLALLMEAMDGSLGI